jgi:hypothetical protein
VPSAPAGDQVLSLPTGKLDDPVWHFGLSDFPTLKLLCPADGRCVHSSHLLCSSLHGQNPEQVLTIPGGSASVVAPMDRTTPPKEDKVGTSSMKAPMALALVSRPESEAPDDNLGGDAPDLLNAAVVGSEIAGRTSSWLQMCWPNSEKPDCSRILDGPIVAPPDANPTFLVLHQEDVEGGLWATLWLAPLILLPLAILQTFRLDHPQWSFFPYDNLLSLGRLGLRWPNQNLLSLELDDVHIHREWVRVELHLGTLYKFQSSFVYGRLNLSTKDIAIVSSMRIRTMPFTICILFELFQRRYDLTTWQLNLFFLQQVVKNPITLSDVECLAYFILSAFRGRL